jgi:RNA polymerase sigma-54 factor
MKLHLKHSQQQQLHLTPQLQNAIALLPLSQCELQTEMLHIAMGNPLLDCELLSSEEETEEGPTLSAHPSPSQNQTLPSSQSRDEWQDIALSRLQEKTLYDHLREQMAFFPLTPEDSLIAHAMINSIDKNGYLTTPLASFSQSFSCSLPKIEELLTHLQRCDPIGIAARNLQECLLLQLHHFVKSKDIPETLFSTACRMVKEYLSLLGKNKSTLLCKNLSIDKNLCQEAIALIQQCHPRPGTRYDPTRTEYVIPDAFVFKTGLHWNIRINTAYLPKIRIHGEYAELLRQCQSNTDRQFIKTHLHEARWFLKSIDNRHDTLFRVVQSIVHHQKDFLEKGERSLKPMILQTIAKELSLHESTVSRITTNKYINTPRGVFELKYFFSGSVPNAEGPSSSNKAIRAWIKEIIQKEDPTQPKSDQYLSTLLHEQGVSVARRTVAKYRELLQIPASHERKKII